MRLTFDGLRSANIRRQAEWDPDNRLPLSFRGLELAGEAGEACNVIKKLERERLGIAGSRGDLDQLGEELADTVICADLVALDAGVDLAAAIGAKFNKTSEKLALQARLAAALTAARLAELIAEEIARQGSAEFDNLGDNESIYFVGLGPTINLVELAECILAVVDTGEQTEAAAHG